MVAISSHRRHALSPEYARNQAAAAESWSLFSHVFYFGQHEPELTKENTLYVKSDDWPSIKAMAEFAAWQNDELVAIINADIVVTNQILEVEQKMNLLTMPCATSYRYEFDPNRGLDSAVRIKNDRGMDIFVARPEVWGEVAKRIPEYLRIGHNRWDSWLCGFFCHHYGLGFRQFTGYKCIFHPKHDSRSQPIKIDYDLTDEYYTRATYPSPLNHEHVLV